MSDQDCILVIQQFLDTSTGSKLTFFRALYGKVSEYLNTVDSHYLNFA